MDLHKKILLAVSVGGILVLALIGVYATGYRQPPPVKVKAQELPAVAKQALTVGRELKIPILMYHHVGSLPENPDPTREDLTVSVDNFQQQVAWLAQNGYHSVSLQDLYLYSLGKFTMPIKPLVFTFDDGYQDVFLNAIPVLRQFGYSGSFGIITRFVGTTSGDNVYATWPQIALAEQGGSEIVSHTQNHFDGTNPEFPPAYIYQNLSGSVADIYSHLGFYTHILIYPYGHYNTAYLQQAKKAGFVMGVTTEEGDTTNLDGLMEVPRVRVHGAEALRTFEGILTYGPSVYQGSSTPAD